jgi:hypothetical protein
MWLMEIYKDDGTDIKRQPIPVELELFSQHHRWWNPHRPAKQESIRNPGNKPRSDFNWALGLGL